ncbi:MAG: filamentous hemagglutinin N-terminal domain-containing protein [Xenococcaceae cyanobacterium MO_167.B27]|nr:filamentous hemagglutinin N-terminal domain-containing protein [Xenococcaceae cyanobacterium MO_167.B27]
MQVLDSILPSICLGITLVAPVKAQITTDGTTNTTLTPTDKGIRIDEGSRAGGNLFHSFGEFSVPTGREAFFNNASDVVNIFSRVTGGNISNIDGLIRANGGANLFLINPHGIIFGNNASLQIGGSFYGSTADSIIFSDGVEFAASNPVKPILTVNAPIGLRFRDSPGDIVNQSVAEGVGLTVAPGENLALIGGNIALEGGNITANEGRGNIELGSVAGNSVVNLEPVNSSFKLGYDQVTNFGNIALTQGARIETTESNINLQGDLISLNNSSQITSQVDGSQVGGDININARKLVINDRANINATTFGEGNSGNINVDVSDSIDIVGTGFEEFQELFIRRVFDINNPLDIETLLNDGTGIFTATNGIGAAGNVTINSTSLQLREGALIGSPTFAKGDGGRLTINTTDSIELIGSGIFNNPFLGSTGEGNTLEIKTLYLTISDGGIISTSTFGSGNGAELIINASDQIDILRALPNSLVGTGIFSNSIFGSGDAGNITITTQKLNLQDGGQIISVSGALIEGLEEPIREGGTGGNINIIAYESIEIIGNNNFPSAISSNTFTENNSGNLDIKTNKLIISDGAAITASTIGSGQGGSVVINAFQSIEVFGNSSNGEISSSITSSSSGDFFPNRRFEPNTITGNGGTLSITTEKLLISDNARVGVNSVASGNAGDVNIIADSIRLENGSQITAQTVSGIGGNIIIDADLIFAFPNQNNDILANSEQGDGGNITITSEGILGIQQREFDSFDAARNNTTNDIDASSELGVNGNVTLNIPDTNIVQTNVDLPSQVVSAETVASDACSVDNGTTSFIINGKGGVPPAPNLPLSGEVLLGDGKPITYQETSHNIVPQVQPVKTSQGDIYPARGIIKTEDGRIILTPYPTANSPARFPDDVSSCRLRDER